MVNIIDIIDLIVAVSGITIALTGLFFSLYFPYLKRPDRSYLIVFFILLTLYCVSDLASQISLVFLGYGFMQLSQAFVFLESLFSSLCMPLLTMYILTCAGRKLKGNLFLISSVSIWILYFILLCLTQISA